VRGYLAGETAFADDALAMTAAVATDFLSQNTCFVPSRGTIRASSTPCPRKACFTVRFVFGENHPPQMRAIAGIGPGPGLIFLNARATSHGSSCFGMMETAGPEGSLAAVQRRTLERLLRREKVNA